jgi:hypothetical protein
MLDVRYRIRTVPNCTHCIPVFTQATPLKYFPPEEPNLTNPVEVLEKLKAQDETQLAVNLNNVEVSEKTFLEIFDALKFNKGIIKQRVIFQKY